MPVSVPTDNTVVRSAETHAAPTWTQPPEQETTLVSVVLPVLNGERFLPASLDSILAQTHRPLEVIVLDDGSTDATPEIIASYGELVRYVRQPETRGIYGNANDGIGLATGEVIGVFHADDVYLPEMVEREAAFLEAHPEVGAVFCTDAFIDGEGREIGGLVLPRGLRGGGVLDYGTVLNGLLTHKNRFLRCPTALVRRSVYEDVGLYRDEEFKNTSDLEMWLRIARSYPLGLLDERLMLYRRGHGSSSERYHRARVDQERFFAILDRELAAGGRAAATASALRSYEGHRDHDRVMRSVSLYVLGDRCAAQSTLRYVRLRRLAAGVGVQRWRMAALAVALRLLVRIPHSRGVAATFARRWHRGQDAVRDAR